MNGSASGASASSTKTFKHLADSQWNTFVEKKLNKFETKWTKKLETYTEDDHQVDHEEVEVEINSSDSDDDIIMKEGSEGSLSKSVADHKLSSIFDEDDLSGKYNDDWAVTDQKNKEYLANQFWKTPEQFNLEDLLKDAEL